MSLRWRIEFLEAGPADGEKQFIVNAEAAIIGRSAGADVLIGWDKKISRFHVKIERFGNAIRVTDLRSTNGVSILEDGKWNKIDQYRDIPPPSVVRVGDTALAIRYEEVEAEEFETETFLLSTRDKIADKKLIESIMVLDLCGSSRIASEKGDEEAFHVKKRMFEICGGIFADLKPNYAKSTGDGFYAVYETPEPCLNAALHILEKLSIRNRLSKNLPINVRIAIHHGATFILDEKTTDRHGNDLNIAFRMEGVTPEAFGGQPQAPIPPKDRLIVSDQFLKVCNQSKDMFRPLGHAHLKGIEAPVMSYILTHPNK